MRGNSVARSGYRSAVQARRLLANVVPAAGILHCTIATDPAMAGDVVVCTYEDGTPYFLVRSEKFPERCHILHQEAGAWRMFGEANQSVIDYFAAKVEAFRNPAIEEVVEVAAASDGEGVNNVNALAEAAAMPMSPAERAALERKEAFEQVCLKIRIMEVRFRQANAAKAREVAA